MKLKPSELDQLAQNPNTREKLAKAGLLSADTKKGCHTKTEVQYPNFKDTPEYKEEYKKVYTYMDLVFEKKPLRTWFIVNVIMKACSWWANKEMEKVKNEQA